jgi:hypothetical protein
MIMDEQISIMYDLTIRVVVEIASAILCFILLVFMIKPYRLTREGRYLGLPLGFSFLGVSYFLGAIALSGVFSSFLEVACICFPCSYIPLFKGAFEKYSNTVGHNPKFANYGPNSFCYSSTYLSPNCSR